MRIADVIICGNALNFTLKLLLLQEDGDGNVNYEEFVTIMFKVRNNFRQSSVEDISLCLAETRVKSADWKDVPTPNGQQCINYKKLSIGSCHPTVSFRSYPSYSTCRKNHCWDPSLKQKFLSYSI